MNSQYSLIVFLDSFRNLGLSKQAHYKVRLRIFTQDSDGNILHYATPIRHSSKIGFILPDNGVDGYIDKLEESFHTPTVPVVFMDDIIDLHTFVEFKLNVMHPAEEEPSAQVVVECVLMSIDHRNKTQPLGQKLVSFTTLASFKAHVRNYQSGLSEYLPIIFEENHFCQVDGILQMSLTSATFEEPSLKEDLQKFKACVRLMFKRTFESFKEAVEFLRRFRILDFSPMKNKNGDPLVSLLDSLMPFFSRNLFDHGASLEITRLINAYLLESREETLMCILQHIEDHFFSNNNNPKEIEKKLLSFTDLFHKSACNIFSIILELKPTTFKRSLVVLRDKFKDKLNKRLTESINRRHFPISELFKIKQGAVHGSTWNHRNSIFYRSIGLYYKSKIEHVALAHSPEHQPMIFEEVFEKKITEEPTLPHYGTPQMVYDDFFEAKSFKENPELRSVKDLIKKPKLEIRKKEAFSVDMLVLVHGYQGTANDMRSLRGFFGSHYPELHIMVSKANEGQTHTDIDSQGFRLASEIKRNIKELVGESNLRSISFMGHSLGGVVIRAALPYLREFQSNFRTYMSLCSPHLGAISSGNKLVDIGMWYLRNVIKCDSILQVMGRDHWAKNQTFLHALSLDFSLSKFKNIILTGSPQGRFPNLASLAFGFLPKQTPLSTSILPELSKPGTSCQTHQPEKSPKT